jgi:redox-sensitive bicupin YhaK (pirin superfamily)
VVSPADALPGWDQMPDEGPLIFRVSMDAGEDQAAFCPGFDSVWFVLEGTVKVNGTITVASGEFFCAGADVSCSLKASNEGAHWLVFSSRSQQPL